MSYNQNLSRLRVRLAKEGMSQSEIDSLFAGVDSYEELTSLKAMANKLIEILNHRVNGNEETFGLIKEFVRFFNEHNKDSVDIINVTAKRDSSNWVFNVSMREWIIREPQESEFEEQEFQEETENQE